MEKYEMPLARIVTEFFPSARHPTLIFDTNTIGYNWGNPIRASPAVVTSGVFSEAGRNPLYFPEEAIYMFAEMFEPNVITNMVSPEDEALILKAAAMNKSKKRQDGDMGWTDMQQLGLLIEHARELGDVVAVSNDRDITETIENLKRLEETQDFAHSMGYASPRAYLSLVHKERLKGLSGGFRNGLLRSIDNAYRARIAA